MFTKYNNIGLRRKKPGDGDNYMVTCTLMLFQITDSSQETHKHSIWCYEDVVVKLGMILFNTSKLLTPTVNTYQARRQKFSEGGSFDTAGGLGAAQGSQKPLGIWCKILQSSNHSNFRKTLFSITNF